MAVSRLYPTLKGAEFFEAPVMNQEARVVGNYCLAVCDL